MKKVMTEPDGARRAKSQPVRAKGVVSVSVVVPVYNSKRYLRKCLDSLAGQTQKDIEVICVDDGSTDGSSDILQKYAKKDDRFKFVRQENQGPSVARNTGISLAKGDYLYFVDSDDWLERDALERLVSLADSQQFDHIAFSAQAFCDKDYENGALLNSYAIAPELALKPMSGVDLAYLLLENHSYFSVVWAHFLRMSVVRRSALSFPPGLLHEDEYFVPISLVAAGRSVALADMLYHRRMRRDSIMTTPGMERVRMQNCMELAKMLKDADDTRFAADSRERQFLNRRAKSLENSAVKYSEALPLDSLSPAEVNSIMAIYRRIRSENQEKRIAAEKKEAAEITALREKLSDAEAKRAAAEAKVEAVNAKLARRDEWLAAEKKNTERAEAKLAAEKAKIEALNAKLARRDEWLATEKKNAERAEAKRAAAEAKVEAVNAKLARRDEWLATEKKNTERAEAKRAAAEAKVEAVNAKLARRDEWLAAEKKNTERAEAKRAAAEAKVEAVNAKLARRDEWLAAEKKNTERAEAKLAAEKAKVEAANAKIARRDEWLSATKAKSAKLQTQLEAMKRRAADLAAANHSKDVELARLRKEAARLAKVESVVFARSSTSRK